MDSILRDLGRARLRLSLEPPYRDLNSNAMKCGPGSSNCTLRVWSLSSADSAPFFVSWSPMAAQQPDPLHHVWIAAILSMSRAEPESFGLQVVMIS